MGKQKKRQQRVTGVVQQNIDALLEARRRYDNERTWTDHVADAITMWSGSMLFVYLHVIFFGVWIAANSGVLRIAAFDPFPFGLLTTIVSLEAIFLSTFVLVSQNRQAALADRRSDLDLQIDLLSEREITRILQMVHAVAEKLEVKLPSSDDVDEFQNDISPREILSELDKTNGKPAGS